MHGVRKAKRDGEAEQQPTSTGMGDVTASSSSSGCCVTPDWARLPLSVHPIPRSVCDLCAREAGALIIQHHADRRYPAYHSCSTECDEGLIGLVNQRKGFIDMADITSMEQKAVEDARQVLWQTMVAWIGEERAMELFGTLSAGQIDKGITDIWIALHVSMQRQSATGEIPF
jgi:hypothetical protein